LCARLVFLSPPEMPRPAHTWLPAGVRLVGSSPPREAPRRTRPAQRCPGTARAAQPPILPAMASAKGHPESFGRGELRSWYVAA